MKTELHHVHDITIAELVSDELILTTAQEALDLMVNVYYSDIDRMILYEKNMTPTFFDLKTGLAGEILQKFSNYSMRLAIIGDFSGYQSKSLTDFMYESNRQGKISFVKSLSEAKEKLSTS